MSAITIDLLDYLRKRGMDDESIRHITQAFDQSVQDALREAKAHADRHRAETDEKIKANAENAKAREAEFAAKFVSAEKYHERDKTLVTREEFRAEMAELRKDFRAEISELRRDMNTAFQRLFIGGLIAVIGGFGAVIGGIITIIGKLSFGA